MDVEWNATTDTERQKLKIRRASHPPTAEATNTNARIVEFYRRNSSDLRKEFEALKQSIANPPTSSSSKRSFVPDKNLLKTLHSEERRQNSSTKAASLVYSCRFDDSSFVVSSIFTINIHLTKTSIVRMWLCK